MAVFFAGVDLGSTSTKAVIVDGSADIVGTKIIPSGSNYRKSAENVMESALSEVKLTVKELAQIVTTGYGRFISGFESKQVSEITCCALGAHYLHPTVRTIIDIGGQDSKAIKTNQDGKVVNFSLNDKCAAGTGRFLERIAVSLELSMDEIAALSMSSQEKLPISSTCTIFAETEVISRISGGEPIASIVKGLHNALATRIHTLLVRLNVEKDIFMCGGGAKNAALVHELEGMLGDINVPSEVDPCLVPGIGAALKAREHFQKNSP